jgi:hypothetical protein
VTALTLERPLDERIARAAVAWIVADDAPADEVAERLLALAAGNRTAVERALARVSNRGHAAEALRLALARGVWAW